MSTRWQRFFCALFGHDARGPIGRVTSESDASAFYYEPHVYRCRRCREAIRFAATYPYGWHVWEAEPTDTVRTVPMDQ